MRECRKCEACLSDNDLFCPEDGSETRLTLFGEPLIAKRYLLKKRLGSGAMGQVYLAVDTKFGTREVAVKVVKQELLSSGELQEAEVLARFEREAKATAAINHPNVIAVTDYGETENGIFYLVMEYVEGETLHKLLHREGTLTIKRAVSLLKQIAEGVEAAHLEGILHRDLKPSNIFLLKTPGSKDGHVKVGDFGLAKILDEERNKASQSGPKSHGIIGTPEFMAPEQIDNSWGKIDVRADIYALGTIAYQMIGGKTPFSGSPISILTQKISFDPPPLSSLRSDVPKEIESLIMWALERDVEKRPRSVREWIQALEEAAERITERKSQEGTKLIVLAPQGAEVYLDDERRGTIGNSGRLVLSDVPMGRHVLRISKTGEKDDERVIEIRGDTVEQVIQAKLKPVGPSSSSSPSSILPDIVACSRCGARFAEGVRFCGKCGGSEFVKISVTQVCQRCQKKVPANAKFCGHCGAPVISYSPTNLPPHKTCPRCNNLQPATARFCGRCGIAL